MSRHTNTHTCPAGVSSIRESVPFSGSTHTHTTTHFSLTFCHLTIALVSVSHVRIAELTT